MSKIEKALSKAREGRANLQVVPVGGAPAASSPGTNITVSDPNAHPETIPRMAKNEVRLLGAGDLAQRGIIQPGGDPAVQVFRELRTKIVQQSKGQNAAILVTSVSEGCGGSFIARNLGAAFAFDMGKTALLMDCNLKHPSVHRLLGEKPVWGLGEYFRNPDIDVKEIIHPVGIARFRVIPAGKQGEIPEEHFSSEKMKALMETLRRRYHERFIIVDGPPMSNIADIRILSELVDYVIIVAGYGRSTNAQISKCVDAISEKKLIGVVFNDEPRIPRSR
jgi:capsular exopolysaccharide synthesis family protein